MNIIQNLQTFIYEFNTSNSIDFCIDTIRVEFSKQFKLKELEELGKWSKVEKNSNLLSKLKKRLQQNEITSAWRLEKENVYYYNMQDYPKYRKATLVIFGIEQPHKIKPNDSLISKILKILKDVSSIDICIDLPYRPNTEALSQRYTLTPYGSRDVPRSNTIYINDTGVPMLNKVVIYNKAYKNQLKAILWRIEATISVPNCKALALPLYEFKEIIDIATAKEKAQ